METLIRKLGLPEPVLRHLVIVYYLLQILFIVIYAEPEQQPFVYIRF